MDYDPFTRGPHPVGVVTIRLVDEARDARPLPCEVWYPAAPEYLGLDVNPWTQDAFEVVAGSPQSRQAAVRDAVPAGGRFPLVVFSHTSGGHRRQSSFLCTHLASHGYAVAAVDHTGSTAADLVERARRVAGGIALPPEEVERRIAALIAARVPDLRFAADRLLAGAAPALPGRLDGDRLGLVGWSFGGWAVLAVPEVDDRFGAIVAITPAGATNPVPGLLPVTLTFSWRRQAPVLFLAAERDRWTPVPHVAELLGRAPSPKALFVLGNAGHGHFGDEVEDEALCPPAHARCFTRGLGLAHLDAHLRGDAAAVTFLTRDAEAALRERGVAAGALRPDPAPG